MFQIIHYFSLSALPTLCLRCMRYTYLFCYILRLFLLYTTSLLVYLLLYTMSLSVLFPVCFSDACRMHISFIIYTSLFIIHYVFFNYILCLFYYIFYDILRFSQCSDEFLAQMRVAECCSMVQCVAVCCRSSRDSGVCGNV